MGKNSWGDILMITGYETITVMECAKIVVNESYRIQYGPVIGLAIASIILYILFVLLAMRISKYRKYLRSHKKLEDFVLWEHRRREQE